MVDAFFFVAVTRLKELYVGTLHIRQADTLRHKCKHHKRVHLFKIQFFGIREMMTNHNNERKKRAEKKEKNDENRNVEIGSQLQFIDCGFVSSDYSFCKNVLLRRAIHCCNIIYNKTPNDQPIDA